MCGTGQILGGIVGAVKRAVRGGSSGPVFGSRRFGADTAPLAGRISEMDCPTHGVPG